MPGRRWNLGPSNRPGESRTKRWTSVPSFWEFKGEETSLAEMPEEEREPYGVTSKAAKKAEDSPRIAARDPTAFTGGVSSTPMAPPQKPPPSVASAPRTAGNQQPESPPAAQQQPSWQGGGQSQGWGGRPAGGGEARGSGADPNQKLAELFARMVEAMQVLRENSAEAIKVLNKIEQNTANMKSKWG